MAHRTHSPHSENNSKASSTGPREKDDGKAPEKEAVSQPKAKILLPDGAVNFKTQTQLNLRQVQAASRKDRQEKMQRFKNLGQSVRDVSRKNALQGLKNEHKTSVRENKRSGSNRSINTILTKMPYMNVSTSSSPEAKNPQGA